MGGRINVVLGAWNYAQSTGRKLVVDWSEGYYGGNDCFQHFFRTDFLRATDFYGEIEGLSIYPRGWSEAGLRLGYQNVQSQLYMLPPPEKDVLEDVVVVTWIDNHIDVNRLKVLAQSLRASVEIEKKVNTFMSNVSGDAIGVHYRHGNGEAGVICPNVNWFVDQIDAIDPGKARPIVLCTDAILAHTFFSNSFGERLFSTMKAYPKDGPLHNNKEVRDRLANGEDALVDLFSLARCSDLIESGEFFGKTAWLLGAGKESLRNIYPGRTRLFNSQNSNLLPVGCVPILEKPEFHEVLSGHNVRPDNLFAKTEHGSTIVYYGTDEILTVSESSDIQVDAIISAIVGRRLYL